MAGGGVGVVETVAALFVVGVGGEDNFVVIVIDPDDSLGRGELTKDVGVEVDEVRPDVTAIV